MNHDAIEGKYRELIAFLSQIPESGTVHRQDTAKDFNDLIDQLATLCEDDFGDCKVRVISDEDCTSFWTKGMKLIARLNHKFEFDQKTPSIRPSLQGRGTSLNLTQNQQNEQNTSVAILVTVVSDVTEQLIRAESKYKVDSTERKFIEKMKDGIKSVKAYSDVLLLILSLAQSYGITIETLQKIFIKHG